MLYEGMRLTLNKAVVLHLAPSTSPIMLRLEDAQRLTVLHGGAHVSTYAVVQLYSREPFFAILFVRSTGQAVHPGLLSSELMEIKEGSNGSA